MFVLKFGGSSVADGPRMLNVLDILKYHKHSYDTNKLVVLSACQGITDKLHSAALVAADKCLSDKMLAQTWGDVFQTIQSHHLHIINHTLVQQRQAATQAIMCLFEELNSLLQGIFYLKELTVAATDAVLAFGELLSTTLFHYICLENSMPNVLLDARNMIFTDDNYGAAVPIVSQSKQQIQQLVNNAFNANTNLIITQGFIAANNSGKVKKTTTLGRGGSDYTAAFIGAILHADEIQIWTDVDGILSADPRVCPNAFTINEMEYDEVKDLSYWGAKVIHPATILPAVQKNINIKVLNSFNPDCNGTVIKSSTYGDSFAIKSVIAKGNCLTITSEDHPLQNHNIKPNALLHCGNSNGLYVALLDNNMLNIASNSYADITSGSVAECFAICITGNNIKHNENRLWATLAELLTCLCNVKLNQIIYEFFANSIILIVSNVDNINDIVQKVHDSAILPFHK